VPLVQRGTALVVPLTDIGRTVTVAIEETIPLEKVGELALSQPVVAYNVPLAASQPPLRVIEGGPQNV
jgi:hypothetical protein